MSVEILLATTNHHKLIELRRILTEADLDIQVSAPDQLPHHEEPAETEWTFEGNALIKARAAMLRTGLPALADDSGLCVDALNQMPGVRSSRWAGPGQDDTANLELLLRQIEDVPAELRGARFVAVVALVLPDGREFTVRGEMSGRIAFAAQGTNGFGYDPIFIADDQPTSAGDARTNGQLSAQEKDAISHRGRALRAMVPTLRATLVDELGEEPE